MTKTPPTKPSQHYNSFTRWVVDGGVKMEVLVLLHLVFWEWIRKKNLM